MCWIQPLRQVLTLPSSTVTGLKTELATGTAEPGGWSTRELLTILDGLVGLQIVGADVVEVAPAYDNAGETTILAAAEIAFSILDLMVFTPVKSQDDEKHQLSIQLNS